MNKELLFKKEIMFHVDNNEELFVKQNEVLRGLEVLRLEYDIKRKSAYGTGTPIWEINVYK